MSHRHRFYLPPDWPVGETIELPEEEAHHGVRVLRLRPGDEVALFNGAGSEWTATVLTAAKRQLVVETASLQEVPRPANGIALIVGQVLRDKTLEEMIALSLPLGVTEYHIFRADHSDRPPKEPARFHKILVETAKQCGALWLPSLYTHATLAEALDRGAWDTLLLASLEAGPAPLEELVSGRRVGVVIGPEGDLSAAECDTAMAQGAKPWSLGPHTLRTELAAAAASAILQHHLLSHGASNAATAPQGSSGSGNGA